MPISQRCGLFGPLLVYDGKCSFCRKTLDFLQKFGLILPKSVPYQDLALVGCEHTDCLGLNFSEALLYVDCNHQLHFGYEAFFQLFSTSNKNSFKLLSAVMNVFILRKVGRYVYSQVASRRRCTLDIQKSEG